jgi:hypothetical protein
MNKHEFIDTMRSERAQWDALLSEIGAANMTNPGAAGDWCVKDLIAHISAYENWLVELFAAVRRGALPSPSVLNDPDVDKRNAVVYAANKDRPLAGVQAESKVIFEKLVAAIEALPEDELVNEKHTAWYVEPFWKEAKPVWEAVAGDSYEHYHEHIPSLRAWWEASKA